MKPPRAIVARVDRLSAPTSEALPGPVAPEGRALASWANAVCDRFADVDPAGVDDDWRKSVAEFRAAARAYAEVLAETELVP